MPRRRTVLAAGTAALIAASGCGTTSHMTVSHRHSPGAEARIVVLPVAVPKDAVESPEREGRVLAALYATELLRSYEVLEYRNFANALAQRGLALDELLDGRGPEAADSLGVDGLLLSEVYEWKPGVPGILFLAKKGRVGFQARLVDARTGSVIWSVNRVRETEPADALSVGLAAVFRELADEMPRELTPY